MSCNRVSEIFNRSYFFDEGLRFKCRQCGCCCTGESGTIYVAPSEVAPIAAFLHISPERLIERDFYPFRDSYSINELQDGRCRFYQNGCAIYPVRPFQCRAWPFWFVNLRSAARWQAVAADCPGIGSGPLFDKAAIMRLAHASAHI